MEFKTEQSHCYLLTLEDDDEPHKQIKLIDGLLNLRFGKTNDWNLVCQKNKSSKQLDDNKWHTISVVCEYRKPIEVTVDGEVFEVETGERKLSKFNCIGCSSLRMNPRHRFKGEVKQFKFTTKP